MQSFAEWMRTIDSRHEEFQKHYDEYTPNADDIAAIKALVASHGVKVLVLGEALVPGRLARAARRRAHGRGRPA